jgi:hypothetical protein
VRNRSPHALHAVAQLLERLDEVFPGRGLALRQQRFQRLTVGREHGVQRRLGVLRPDAVERGQRGAERIEKEGVLHER